MKLIIDIPKELKSEVYRCGVFLSPTEKESLIDAINNGAPIPDNATNEEAIRALFAHTIFVEDISTDRIVISKDWWNSPYQKGEQE